MNVLSLRADHALLFAQLIARTAKDIDVLIDSLPSEESSAELQVCQHASLCRLNNHVAASGAASNHKGRSGQFLGQRRPVSGPQGFSTALIILKMQISRKARGTCLESSHGFRSWSFFRHFLEFLDAGIALIACNYSLKVLWNFSFSFFI